MRPTLQSRQIFFIQTASPTISDGRHSGWDDALPAASTCSSSISTTIADHRRPCPWARDRGPARRRCPPRRPRPRPPASSSCPPCAPPTRFSACGLGCMVCEHTLHLPSCFKQDYIMAVPSFHDFFWPWLCGCPPWSWRHRPASQPSTWPG